MPLLKGVLLSRSGIFIKAENLEMGYQQAQLPIEEGLELYLSICDECDAVIERSVQTASEERRGGFDPPINAIANGNWIGYLPSRYSEYTRSDEQCICLMMMVIYLSTIAGSKTVINSHHYIIHNHRPIIECFPRTVSDSVRMTLVGAFTKQQEIMQRKRFLLNNKRNKEFMDTFLMAKNVLYIKHRDSYVPNQFDHIVEDGAILNRQDTSDYAVNPSIVRVIQFNNTTHNISEQQPHAKATTCAGNCENAADCGLEEEEPVITENTNYLFRSQQSTEHSMTSLPGFAAEAAPPPVSSSGSQDLLIYNSNKLPSKRTIDNFVYCFPFLYVYGRGGYGEARPVHLSEERYLQRLLRLHEGNFAQHYAFLPAAFDVISTKKAFIGQFLSMNVNRNWFKTGTIDKSMLLEAIKHQQVLEKCQKQGITVSFSVTVSNDYVYQC